MSGAGPASVSWPELVSAALVGTARRPLVQVAPVDGAGPTSPAASLLDLAALASARRRAGRRPDRAATEIDSGALAPPDQLPEVPAELTSTLSVLLAGQVHVPGGPAGLVQEWLERCAAAGRRLPHRYLIPVLELAETRPELRPAVAVIADERGRWLARQYQAWPWVERLGSEAAARAGSEAWRNGTRAERSELLRAVRARRPDDARALIEDTWLTDAPTDRAAHLEALTVNLSMADEPRLEVALDDRSKRVRALAADLLERLPQSRRALRMAARTMPLVRRSGLIRPTVEMAFPEEPDADGRRDGITDTPTEPMGPAAWWAVQMVAGTPLSVWEAHLGAAPDVLLERASGCDHLMAGWRRAARSQRDPTWCAALFRLQPRPDLLTAIDANTAADLVMGVLDRTGAAAIEPLLAATPRPWAPALSSQVVSRLLAIKAEHFVFRPEFYTVLASRLDPAAGPEIDRLATHLAERDRQRAHVRNVRAALSMRATISTQFDQLDSQPPSPE